ncbi:MAG TPA: biopolymer transporter ExbD [Fibrobacteria bacterium]|nr:biopolymer transporter ExbD [Fibrobacteria bacterium]HOX52106.1 biopolymer transporter ExbD [Fibrobacteria bacterium]
MRRRRMPLPQPDMNLTNLMDVVLCILVVFMITAPLMTQGVKVELPKAESPALDEKKSVTVSFDGERRIFVDGEETTRESFRESFQKAWGGIADKAVLIEGDRSVPYGLVLETVGTIQEAGATKIGFLTDPPSKK